MVRKQRIDSVLPAAISAEPKVLGEAEVPPMKWNAPDMEGLVKFLVEEKSFNEDRVRKAVERINSSRGKSNQGECQNGTRTMSQGFAVYSRCSTCLPVVGAMHGRLVQVNIPSIRHI
jgi:hypothetical protein